MDSRGKSDDEESGYRSKIWDLDQKLDQPMDAEAGSLKNKYEEKVQIISVSRS